MLLEHGAALHILCAEGFDVGAEGLEHLLERVQVLGAEGFALRAHDVGTDGAELGAQGLSLLLHLLCERLHLPLAEGPFAVEPCQRIGACRLCLGHLPAQGWEFGLKGAAGAVVGQAIAGSGAGGQEEEGEKGAVHGDFIKKK